ncbi:MAG: hypothetical protein ACTSU5_16815 [Promethearchaeota archaeon]
MSDNKENTGKVVYGGRYGSWERYAQPDLERGGNADQRSSGASNDDRNPDAHAPDHAE